MSNTLSILRAPFSNDIEEEKPEHPPPTTPTRRPAGTGFCCAIISFTLAIALGVRLTGGVLGVTSGTVVGTVVVAIGISLKLRQIYYNKAGPGVEVKILARRQSSYLLDERKSPGVAAPKQNLPVLAF